MSWTKSLADSMGADENALKLLFAQLFGYPVMLLHRKLLTHASTTTQHIYFALTGIITGYWFLGIDVLHSVAAIFGTYLILATIGGSLLSVIVSFLFNFLYLIIGYWYTEMDGYLICWTMPHCTLCLRLIALTWDCHDGERGKKGGDQVLSKDQQKAAITETPSLLEMLSHSFFLGGYLVGPQFCMKKFREFTTPGYLDTIPGSPIMYSLQRFGLGVMYMGLFQIGLLYFPGEWPDSTDFYETSFLMKLVLLPIWVRVCLYKYLSLWLLSEGVCILSGLSYSGLKPDGTPDWTGCKNLNLIRLETASRFGHVIEAFNINTNYWSASYVYKRLKFMNNRMFSQAATLAFLALWHGYHVGYFLTFFNEFLTINFEKMWMGLLERSEWMEHPGANVVVKVLGWFYVFGVLPHCYIPFALLTSGRFIRSYQSTYFIFHLFFLTLPITLRLIKPWMRLKPRIKKDE
jgi:lysophospholipid acyltransferase 5